MFISVINRAGGKAPVYPRSKVDKFIIFHYCTVICDVLRPIDVICLKRQHKLI